MKAKRRASVVFWSRQKYSTDNLETRSSTIGKKLNSNVREDGQGRTVTPVVQTSDPLDNVTPALTDGFLRPVIRSVTDSAAVTTATVRDVLKKVSGMDRFKLFLRSVEKPALTCLQVSIYGFKT